MNKIFPGHNISFQSVRDRILECPYCQKTRYTLPDMVLQPRICVVDPPDLYFTVSVDGIPISPTDKHGINNVNIVKRLGTGMIHLHGTKGRTAETMADSIILARLRSGHITHLLSDPGSDLTSKTIEVLNKYLGAYHQIGMVDHPQGNAIERDVAEVKRFIRDLAQHHHLVDRWSEPVVLAVAEYLINSDPDLVTKISPYMLTFGSQDPELTRLINQADPSSINPIPGSEYLKKLQSDIAAVRDVWNEHKKRLQRERTRPNLEQPQNKYQPKYLVFKKIRKQQKLNTFSHAKLGPYEVIKQVINSVHVRSLTTGATKVFPVDELVMFNGSRQDAFELARLDDNSFKPLRILGWRGNPQQRYTLSFLTQFDNDETVWMSYETDISQTELLDEYCSNIPALRQLLVTKAAANKQRSTRNKEPFTNLSVNQKIYVDVRFFGHSLYQFKEFKLPGKYSKQYLLEGTITNVSRSKIPRLIIHIPVKNDSIQILHSDLDDWCIVDAPPEEAIVLTSEAAMMYPFLKALQMPRNWNDLTSDQANDLMDPFGT